MAEPLAASAHMLTLCHTAPHLPLADRYSQLFTPGSSVLPSTRLCWSAAAGDRIKESVPEETHLPELLSQRTGLLSTAVRKRSGVWRGERMKNIG